MLYCDRCVEIVMLSSKLTCMKCFWNLYRPQLTWYHTCNSWWKWRHGLCTLSRRGINVGSNERTMSLSSAASITLICILMATRLNGNSCVSMNGFRILTHWRAGIACANVTAHSSAARVTCNQYTTRLMPWRWQTTRCHYVTWWKRQWVRSTLAKSKG